jgi:hypothetical protein
MLWDYGRMVETSNPKQAILVFQDLLDQEPARSDARMELASALYNNDEAGEAVKVLAKLPGVSYEEAPRYYSLAAYVALKLGDRVQAKALAEMLMNAKKATAADKTRAQQLLAFLNQPERPAPPAQARAAVQAQPAEEGAAPVLRRRPASNEGASTDSASVPPARELKVRMGQASLTGKLVEFVCGDSPKLIVETSSGRKTLLIERPDRIVVTGREAGHAEMSCGPQKPAAAVEIEYDQPGAGTAVDGLVRSVAFAAR